MKPTTCFQLVNAQRFNFTSPYFFIVWGLEKGETFFTHYDITYTPTNMFDVSVLGIYILCYMVTDLTWT